MLDELEEAFDTQQRFVDDAGHELRTPITVIRGHLDLMGDDAEERRATLALIDRRARPDAPHRERPVDPREGRAGRLPTARARRLWPSSRKRSTRRPPPSATARGASRVTDAASCDRRPATPDPGDDAARAERGAAHASRATRSRPVSRVVSTEAELWVRDTGEGIAPGDVERIFDRFARRRAQASLRRRRARTLDRVVRSPKPTTGRVEVASRPGEGSRFLVAVPVDQPPDVQEPA